MSYTPQRNNRLVVWLAVMAGLQSIAGASVLTEFFPPVVGGSVAMVVGALNAATAAYVAGVKPVSEHNKNGQVPLPDVHMEGVDNG